MITEFGQIPSHWKISTISEETELVTDYVANGSFASLKENVTYFKEPKYAVIIRLTDFNNQFKGPFVYIDEPAYNFLKKSKLIGGEIIISNVGAYTGTVFRTPKLSIPQTLGPNSIMVNFKGNNEFYEYWLKSKYGQHMIKGIISGSAQPKFNKTSFRSLTIPVPPIEEQQAIAEVLSSLDDKIGLLQKQNETLESLAQTLFRQWFIEEADDSWEEVELSTLVDTVNGISYKSSQLKESDVAMVTLKSFARDGSFRLDGFKEFVGEYKDKHECSDGDIIVAHTDVTQGALLIGNAIEVRKPKEYRQLLYSMDLVKVVPKNDSDKYFILYTLKNRHFKQHAVGYSNGSTVLHMSKKAVPEYRLKQPPAKLINDFHEKVSAFKEKQRLNESSIVTLKQTRDTLLPKLMSGQVRVKLD